MLTLSAEHIRLPCGGMVFVCVNSQMSGETTGQAALTLM